MLINKEILEIALKQSAIDCNCEPKDILGHENKIVFSKKHEKARAYLPLPFECDLVSYGSNIVAQVSERMKDMVEKYDNQYEVVHCFETPHIIALNEELAKFDYKVCFMAAYFLPDVNILKELPCDYELKLLYPSDFEDLYIEDWSNALCKDRKHLDVLAVGAYDNDVLIGLAGCSKDCDMMYQISVDVKKEYRNQGIASALTSQLSL